MQERRANIRVGQHSRVQYCPSDDLVPKDGQLLNVSERGAGLEVREAHRCGERITVNVSLPGDDEPLTATGVVRWSDLRSPRRRRCRLGLEWLPLEEPARNRLQQFLLTRAHAPRRRAFSLQRMRRRGFRASRAVWLSAVIFGPLLGVLMLIQLLTLRQENRQLQELNEQRSVIIRQLGEQQNQLQQELSSTKSFLAATVEEVTRLDRQAQQLEGELSTLTTDVGKVQASYDAVKAEREELMQRVMDLQLERTALTKQLKVTQELREAITDAIRARRLIRRDAPPVSASKPPDVLVGNRGYIIYDGRPTVAKSTMWIRVLNPSAGLIANPTESTVPAEPPLIAPESAEPSSIGAEEALVAETAVDSSIGNAPAPEGGSPEVRPLDQTPEATPLP